MGLYPDRGLAYLVKGNTGNGKILKIGEQTFTVIIDIAEVDDRLVHLSLYKQQAASWFNECYLGERAIQLPSKPDDLMLTDDEVARINAAGQAGAWYDVTRIYTTY